MKKIILIIFLISFFSPHGFAQSDWQFLNSGVSVNLYGVYFENQNTGYVCGSGGTILKTSDAGVSWNPLNTGVTSPLNDIYFIDNNTGYCCGNNGIMKTTTAGMNWNTVFTGFSQNKIQSIGNKIFSAGSYGIYKSTDFGQNWINTIVNYNGSFWGLFFLNPDTGYGMGTLATMRITSNGGTNWSSGLYWGPGEYTFGECYFFSSGSGYVTYSYSSGYPYYYISNGIYRANTWFSWTQVFNSTDMGIRGLTFEGSDTGYAVGGSSNQSLILKTINGGYNWISQNVNVNQRLYDVFFLNSKTGYAVGSSGIILKTINGGVIGIKSISYSTPMKFSLYQNYPNPFNPVTKIRFSTPINPPFVKGGTLPSTGGFITLKIYDILGREVATLVNEQLKSGTYEVEWDGANFPSGVYYYTFSAEKFIETKKMILIK